MKYQSLIFSIMILIFGFIANANAQPFVLIDEPVYTFEPMPDGVHISHEFKIKNSGNAVLKIINVKPP